MEGKVCLDTAYVPSEDVVARKIAGEFIIVPLVAGIGDLEDELFTLNETGGTIWDRLDGRRSLQDVVEELCAEFEASTEEIERDVMGFVAELFKRGMLVEASGV